MVPYGAKLTLRKCKAGLRMSDLRNPKVLARVSNGQRGRLTKLGGHGDGHKYEPRPIHGFVPS